VWLPKTKTAKLRHFILLCRLTYWALVEMVLGHTRLVCYLIPVFIPVSDLVYQTNTRCDCYILFKHFLGCLIYDEIDKYCLWQMPFIGHSMSLECPRKVNKGELLQGKLRFSLILECLTIKKGCLYVLYVFFVFFWSHWDIPNHGAPPPK